MPLLLPRVTGEGDGTSSSEGGAHSEESRRVNAMALGEMMKGSLTRQITPYVKAIVTGLCEDCLTSDVSVKSRLCFLETLNILLRKVRFSESRSDDLRKRVFFNLSNGTTSCVTHLARYRSGVMTARSSRATSMPPEGSLTLIASG